MVGACEAPALAGCCTGACACAAPASRDVNPAAMPAAPAAAMPPSNRRRYSVLSSIFIPVSGVGGVARSAASSGSDAGSAALPAECSRALVALDAALARRAPVRDLLHEDVGEVITTGIDAGLDVRGHRVVIHHRLDHRHAACQHAL